MRPLVPAGPAAPHRARQFAAAPRTPARPAPSHRARTPPSPAASKGESRRGPGKETDGGGVAAPPPDAGTAATPTPANTPPSSETEPSLTPALLQRAAAAGTPAGAWEVLAEAGAAPTTEAAGTALITAALDAGCIDLAKLAYGAMATAPAAAARSAGSASAPAAPWPRAGPAAAAALVCGLARALRPAEAEAVLDVVRSRGEGALPAALRPGGGGPDAALGPPSPVPGAWPVSASPVGFGVVVSSPGAPGVPLTVIQPHEGGKVVACAACRYEFETWSGTVVRASSAPLGGAAGGVAGGALGRGLASLGRTIAAAAGRPPPPSAVHELDVRAPPGPGDRGGGRVRPFRFATADAAAPASLGDRVTVVCTPLSPAGGTTAPAAQQQAAAAPLASSGDEADALLDLAAFGLGAGGGDGSPPPSSPASAARPAFTRARRGLLAPLLPGTAPGQPLLVSNHGAGTEAAALPAPAPGAGGPGGSSPAFPPPWIGPLMLTLVAADVVAGIADPGLPLALAAGTAAAAGGGAALARWGVPALRRLPPAAVEVEASRQALLTQHVRLTARTAALRAAAAADVRALARLWALRGKMGAVGAEEGGGGGGGGPSSSSPSSSTAGEYETRSARLASAAADLEARLGDAVRLLAGYARLAGRVEIEVELEAGVPAGEAGALGAAGDALDAELASLGEAWRARAAAADEVERLLGPG